jgi:hypothetical protein
MAPAPEPAVFLVPALLLTWFALRTSVPIYTLRVVAFSLVIARCHSGHLLEDFLVISAQLVIMVVVASRPIASRGTLQKEDIAQLELLDALDVLAWYGVIHFVDTLTQAITIDSRGGWHNWGTAGRLYRVAAFVEMHRCCGYEWCSCH